MADDTLREAVREMATLVAKLAKNSHPLSHHSTARDEQCEVIDDANALATRLAARGEKTPCGCRHSTDIHCDCWCHKILGDDAAFVREAIRQFVWHAQTERARIAGRDATDALDRLTQRLAEAEREKAHAMEMWQSNQDIADELRTRIKTYDALARDAKEANAKGNFLVGVGILGELAALAPEAA